MKELERKNSGGGKPMTPGSNLMGSYHLEEIDW
jgi:hypothetical protein